MFRVRTAEIWWESEATLAPIHFFHTLHLGPGPSLKSFGPKFYSQTLGSLIFKFIWSRALM